MKNKKIVLSGETTLNNIYCIRGQQVMLDFDAAELYEVDMITLRRSIRRNHKRFPSDFLYILTEKEWADLKTQVEPLLWAAQKSPPLAFTVAGLLMLSGVLKSKRAAQVSIYIIDVLFSFKNSRKIPPL